MGAHTTSDDPTKYRVSAEVEVWKLRDPIERLKAYLAHEGKADHDFFDDVDREADELAAHVREGCLTMPDPTPAVDVRPRLRRAAPAHRGGARASSPPTRRSFEGEEVAGMTLADHRQGASRAGLRRAMEDDPKVVLMGEDIGKLGGVFRVTEGLQKDFGEERVIDTPLAEAGIVGTAIGLALRGYRPVVEIQFDGFVYPAFDQIVSQVAKMRARSLGLRHAADGHPHPRRRRHRRGRAPQRVQRGLLRPHRGPARRRVLQPAGRLLDDPAGHRDRRPGRSSTSPSAATGTRARSTSPPPRAWLFEAHASLREGTDCTVLAYGPMVKTCLQAAQAAEEEGKSIEVVDLRSLSPLDHRHRRRPRSRRPAGWSSSTRRRPSSGSAPRSRRRSPQRAFYALEAPVLRVGGYNLPYPPSRLEEEFLPDLDRVLDAVDRALAF